MDFHSRNNKKRKYDLSKTIFQMYHTIEIVRNPQQAAANHQQMKNILLVLFFFFLNKRLKQIFIEWRLWSRVTKKNTEKTKKKLYCLNLL